MSTIPRASAEQVLEGHSGVAEKSQDGVCVTDYFSPLDYWGKDSAYILDNTLGVEYGTHNTSDGHLVIYRECGKVACQRQCGVVVDAAGKILDSQPFVSPCTKI